MGCHSGSAADWHHGLATIAPGGQRCRAVLGRIYDRVEPHRAVSALPQAAGELVLLDCGGHHLRSALLEPGFAAHCRAVWSISWHVPEGVVFMADNMEAHNPRPFRRGLVIGKFYPPHRGHEFLIRTALEQSHHVDVIVCGKPDEQPSGDLRQSWLQELFPSAAVRLIDDQYDSDDSQLWARLTIEWLGYAPDAVFTSEDYGDRYAFFLQCRHVKVDQQRVHVPCCGTNIRHRPLEHWEFLSPPVRGWYVRRVCVLGAESTGTTTLAEALAVALETNWVAEYGREYSGAKLSRGETCWQTNEFTHIAGEQERRENLAAREANKVLICDTNAFATTLWHRRYMGFESEQVMQIARRGKCDLYLLTGDEIPFVQDGLRDGEMIRHEMHRWFEEALKNQTVPWRLLRGSHQERLCEARAIINTLLNKSVI